MTDPYRTAGAGPIKCPRCATPLPALDVASCVNDCGTWVTTAVSDALFEERELAEDRITRWWRVRAPCPVCAKQMTLRGLERDSHFQGCTRHGYWIDADTVSHTGLGAGDPTVRIEAAREELAARTEQAKRARERTEAERRESEQRNESEREGRRAALVERINAAIARRDSRAIVDEFLRLEVAMDELEKRLEALEHRARDAR